MRKRAVDPMRKLRFLITAGPTREFIDPVRFISNRSSGKMGYALAAEARKVSSHITLVSGPVALKPPRGVRCVNVTTADEMAKAVFAHSRNADIIIMAAAVADFRPQQIRRGKIKKASGIKSIKLEPTVDILRELGRRKSGQLLVGFAAETGTLHANALKKLRAKHLDLMVANDVTQRGAGFDVNTNIVTLFWPDGRRLTTPRLAKSAIAARIIRECMALAMARLQRGTAHP